MSNAHIWVHAVLADVNDACGSSPNAFCSWVYESTENTVLSGAVDWFLERPIRIVVIAVTALVCRRLLRRAVDRLVQKAISEHDERTRVELAAVESGAPNSRASRRRERRRLSDERYRQRVTTIGSALGSAGTFGIATITLLLVLGELSINLGPLIAGAGIVGLAIGFGAQTLVRDVIAGVFVMIEDQYGVGDVVDVGEATGTVEQVTLRTTRLRDVQGVLWFVPNGEIRRVGNHSQLWSRTVLDIEVAYDTDLDHATAVIKSALDSVWHESVAAATVLGEPEVWGVEDFGESAIKIRAVLTTEPSEQWAVARLARARIKTAFDDAGIEIPFPHHVVLHSQLPPAD